MRYCLPEDVDRFMCYFSFSLSAVNLCHSHITAWRQKQKTFVLHLWVTNVVKGNESQKQNSLIPSNYWVRCENEEKGQMQQLFPDNSLLLCGDISLLCEAVQTQNLLRLQHMKCGNIYFI